MRNVYFLAAGFVTGLAFPISSLQQQLMSKPDHYRVSRQKTDTLQAIGAETIFPTMDNTDNASPEFSNRKFPVSTESTIEPIYQPVRQIFSNNQLYNYRLAALKAGQIYTRLGDNELQPLWESSQKRQLTYEDWKKLLAMEAKAMIKGQGANRLSIMVGDSISMWFPSEKLPTGKLWLNQGISGDTSTGIFNRLSAFAATKPDVIYLMAGINDLRKGTSDEVILRNQRNIIRRLRRHHPNSLIIVQSILPIRLSSISNSRIRRLNSQLALIAKREGANYLNLHDWFTDFQGNLREDLTTDGLHLNGNGYDVWRAVLEQTESQLALKKLERSQ